MRLLWLSAAPWNCTGYGIITCEMLKRLKSAGHTVFCGAKHNTGSWMRWEGFDIFQSTSIPTVNEFIELENIDYAITLLDTWNLKRPISRWVAYYPTDTHYISPMIVTSLEHTYYQIAMSKWGKEQLERYDYKPMYAPHAVDTEMFKPDAETSKLWRNEYGLKDDIFVIGSVGSNYPDDRKGFIRLIRAFKHFHKRHKNSILYLHTKVTDEYSNVPLPVISNNLGLGDSVYYVNPREHNLERISDIAMGAIYNGMDVHCLATKGEGFGIPIIESQACGTPTITTATTSGPELVKDGETGWLIPLGEDDFEWSPMKIWRANPSIKEIDNQLEKAYQEWIKGDLNEYGKRARKHALDYSWDNVWDRYWLPVLKFLDEHKEEVREREKNGEMQNRKGLSAIPVGGDLKLDA